MKKMTLYEQLGIVIPGSVLLFGLIFFFASLRELLVKDGVSVGQLGIFVLLSYAAGHLIAAVGNLGEMLLWRFCRRDANRLGDKARDKTDITAAT